MIKQASLTLTAMLFSMPLVAQLPAGQTSEPKVANQRVISAMGVKFNASKCSPKGEGHFLVSSVKTYYANQFTATGVDAKAIEDIKAKALKKAVEVDKDAIMTKGQDKNGAAWYWLGRVYLQQGDVPGADTALARAETLLPDCGQEIKSFRQQAYNSMVSPAVQLQREGKSDSAVALYHEALMMSKDAPTAYLGMAIIASMKTPPQNDTAIAYYVQAQTKAVSNPQYTHERDQATLSLAVLYQEKGMDKEGIAEARKLVGWNPTDVDAKRLLYSTLGHSSNPADQAEAKTIQADLLVAAEAAGTITAGDLARNGVDQFNAGNLSKAADYFEKALVKEPWRRDILGNAINTYFAQKDFAKMIQGLNRELAAEPLNTTYLQMLLIAKQNTDTSKANLLALAERYYGLVTGLVTQPLIPTATGGTIQADAVGLAGADAKGKPIPPAPITIVVEFLDNTGTVIGTTEVTIPALKTDEKSVVKIEGVGKGIADWRYHVK